jgi:hypothetical protein
MYSSSSLCPGFREKLEDKELIAEFVDGLKISILVV